MTLALMSGVASANGLPLNQVVLFTSGVAYYERVAEVDQTYSMELSLTREQLQDLIKSMVFIDEGGGQVGIVRYESHDPAARTLATFRLNLGDNPNLGEILNRLRGTRVRLQAGGRDIEGQVVGVESRFKLVDKHQIEEQVLKIHREGTLQALPLDQVFAFEFLDEALQNDLSAALGVLAGSLNSEKKTVTLEFRGDQRRKVRVGYILEAPIWKMSYRLVITDDRPFLQGWAHIENTTDEDWQNVTLSLVSGQPLAFIQNLYDPIYRKRPVIAPDVQDMIAPPVFDGVLEDAESSHEMMMESASVMAAPSAPRMMTRAGRPAVTSLAEGVDLATASRETGELFEHTLGVPVSLPRHQGAMLPIINALVEGQSVSIFNPAVHERHPLNGIALENTAPLFLRRGPVTVFEAGMYAGDARLSDLPQKEKTLLAYALDLKSEVQKTSSSRPEEIVSLRVSQGTLLMSRRFEDTTTYTIRNRRETARHLIIEHPVRPEWTLIEPVETSGQKPERTRDMYRIRLEVPRQESHILTVREERRDQQRIVLSNLNQNRIHFFLQQKQISQKLRNALKQLADMQQQRADLEARLGQKEQSLQEIITEQGRIRDNMRTVAPNSESYFLWERKLLDQESSIDNTRSEIQQLRQQFVEKKQQIQSFLNQLDIE